MFSSLSLLEAQERIKGFEERAPEARERLASVFGRAAEDAAVIEEAFLRAKERRHVEIDRSDADAAIERLSSLDARRLDRTEKSKVAAAWRQAAAYTKHLDGPTEESLLLLETAFLLDPDNESLAKEVAGERLRKQLAAKRLVEIERIQAALARGEDPWDDIPDIGNGALLGGQSNKTKQGGANR